MERNQFPQTLHHNTLLGLEPAMRYAGGDLAAWQKEARAKLAALSGLDRITPAADDAFFVESRTECDGFTDILFRFQSEDGYFVPVHLWVPAGKDGKIPGVICLQGHSKGYHISMGRPIYPGDENSIAGGDRDFAVQIVREGWCAIVIEQRSFGECGGTEKGPTCHISGASALLYGRTLIAERVFDISRTIDMLEEHFADTVDCARLACMGNSGGGTATIYAAALEERIQVAMPSCAFCCFKDSIGAMHHCLCNYIPKISLDFEMGDIGGMIAPRPLAVVSGAKDEIFPHHGVEEAVNVTKAYYAAVGAEDRVAWIEGAEGHRFYADLSWPVFHKYFDEV